jgi:chorismate mutase
MVCNLHQQQAGQDMTVGSSFELEKITTLLEGLEETIIFKLIDRAQFRCNSVVYIPGRSGFAGASQQSLFSLRLRNQEEMDSRFGRFCVAEERQFCTRLPKPKRTVTLPPTGLFVENINAVNLGEKILEAYLGLVPKICRKGDDGHYGSSVEHDVYALQAIARRIHYGALYVAESKFLHDRQRYTKLILAKDAKGLISLLTRPSVEDMIVERIRGKVDFAQARVNPTSRHIIDPAVVHKFYRDAVIPLTKRGEVLYLLNRTLDQV